LFDRRLHQVEKRLQFASDLITPTTDGTFGNFHFRTFEQPTDLAVHRKMIAVFVHEHCRDELGRHGTFSMGRLQVVG